MGGSISNTPGRLTPLSAPIRPATVAPAPSSPVGPGYQLPGDSLSVTSTTDHAPGLSDLVARVKAAQAAQEARTPAKARQEAEGVWSDTQDWESAYRHIEKDFRDVNAPVDAAQAKAANDQIAANQELESQALGKLDPNQKAAYDRVCQLTKQDPPARLALQVLLLEGKLTGGKTATGGKDLLGELDRMATQPLHKAIDRSSLVSDLLQEVATPSSINQKNRATCIFTSLQIQMVLQHPAEYARLVGGLASPEGKVTLADGATMSRHRNAEKEDGTRRSISTRLWTTGLMAHGAPPALRNDPKVAIDDIAGWVNRDRVLAGLGGKARLFEGINPNTLHDRMDEMVDRFKDLTAQGTPVRISLDWGEGGQEHALHEVMLTGIANDRAYYTNPWGTEESMSLAEFRERLIGIPHVVEFGQPTP